MTDFAALDLSLTATGVAWTTGPMVRTEVFRSRHVGCTRLVDLRNLCAAACSSADLVVIEGYSFSSRQGGERLGELGGVVRVALFEAGVPFVEVPPAVVKKLATGAGNAKKLAVALAASRRLQFAADDDNEADARWLLEAALQYYRHPALTPLPEAHTSGLGKVGWPKLTKAAVA